MDSDYYIRAFSRIRLTDRSNTRRRWVRQQLHEEDEVPYNGLLVEVRTIDGALGISVNL
ncbi:hypothetical protein ACLOJK_025711 [Asimina triloba]